MAYTLSVLYLIQFPAGATSLVNAAVSARFARVHIEYVDDSSMVFESSTHIRSADAIPYAKNVFVVHAEVKRRALPASIGALAVNLPRIRPCRVDKKPGFRLMYHIDGQLVSVEPQARRSLESAVGRATGMRPTPRGQCQEFWVVGRRESPVLRFAERLPGDMNTMRAKGALSKELSALLVAASAPLSDDVFLDPFAGSGALIAARLRRPARTIIYNDLDLERHRDAFPPPMNRRGEVVFLSEDALRLPSVEDGSIDVIVTDPPWGEHDDGIGDYRRFATKLATAFMRALNPEVGRAVILVNRRNEEVLIKALTESSMKIDGTFRILVNGHPATAVLSHMRHRKREASWREEAIEWPDNTHTASAFPSVVQPTQFWDTRDRLIRSLSQASAQVRAASGTLGHLGQGGRPRLRECGR
jgi:16S rRNA G966 N2-methylase RsmD